MAFLRVCVVLLGAGALSGCAAVSYVAQAGLGQLSLYNRERPLQEVVDDQRTPHEVRGRLKWVPEIKRMVEDELGIEATKNYTTYVPLDRPYVIWSVTAADPYSLTLKQWSFPIVGSFPYLGFFSEDGAANWAKGYQERGFDTYVRGVTAYSTIGYLRDPLLSTMLHRARKSDFVNLIFHESTHGQIYLKGEVAFNEQIASYVGDYGERAWIEREFGASSKEMKRWDSDRADRRRFGVLLRAFADELKRYYESSVGDQPERRKSGKNDRFRELVQRLENERWKGRGYARAGRLITNNAGLLAFLTYEDEQRVFELLHEKCGGRLKDALRYLKSFGDRWDDLKSAASGGGQVISPQAVLSGLLVRDAAGVVCLDPHFD